MENFSMNRQKNWPRAFTVMSAGGALLGLLLAGCANHADFIELREEVGLLTKAQEQAQKRNESLQRRLQALETGRPPLSDDPASKGHDPAQQRVQELTARLGDLESRLSRLEDGKSALAAKQEEPPRSPSSRQAEAP